MASLYAEYLPNVKTLAITTLLSTPRDDTTALWLTNDRSKLILEHADQSHRITLPAKVSGQGSQHLQLPNTGELQCVSRIPATRLLQEDEAAPLWSAASLTSETRVHCERCDALVSHGVHVWKDLPSEAWAEMMDLWHCHKPAEPEHNHDDASAKKGYAAGNKLVAQAGTGLVDVLSFLLSETDCDGIELRASKGNEDARNVHCKSCDSFLGYRDPQTEGIRLQKPYLALSRNPLCNTLSYKSAHWFSCYLSSAIETQGVRKFVFPTLPYELWVFSTNLAFASLQYPEPRQAMKVLFRERQGGGDVETLRAANLLIETLALTPTLEKLLHQVLQQENTKLPESLKSFMGWDVAILPVLCGADVELETA